MNIRLATISDAEGIAQVSVNSWKTTYKGIISDVFLNQLSVERRKENWVLALNHLKENDATYVAEEQGTIRGFIKGGNCRETDMAYEAEVYAIYLLEEDQGKGYGTLLFNRLVETLRSKPLNSLMVWVLERNPSIDFYKRLGGQFITKKEIKIGENIVTEVALGWKDLSFFGQKQNEDDEIN